MSKPTSLPRSSPVESGFISVPALAGFCSHRRSRLPDVSYANSIVAAGRFAKAANDEFVYAEPTTVTSAGVSFVSFISRLPGSGSSLKLSSASLVMRILSTVGLKSKPIRSPWSAVGVVSNAGPSATAIAVLGLTR